MSNGGHLCVAIRCCIVLLTCVCSSNLYCQDASREALDETQGEDAAPHCETAEQWMPLREFLQARIAQTPELDGVRIDCVVEAGTSLLFRGISGDPSQHQHVEVLFETVKAQLGEAREWQHATAKQWVVQELTPVALQSFLDQIQSRFLFNRPKYDGIWIKRGYFDGQGVLSFEVVAWTPEGESPSEDVRTDRWEKFRTVLMENIYPYIADDWPQYQEGGELRFAHIETVPHPAPFFRELIASQPPDKGIDGARIDRVYYDKNRMLTCRGICKDTGQQEGVLDLLRTTLGEDANWENWLGKGLVSQLELVPLDEMFRRIALRVKASNLKGERLANADRRPADKVRIDRFFYDATNRLTLHGIRWNEAEGGATSDWPEPLQGFVLGEASQRYPRALAANETSMLRLDGIQEVASPLRGAWNRIPEDAQLDGLRLDAAYYDGRGTLHFTGVDAVDGQVARLGRWLEDNLSQRGRWAERGFVFDTPRRFLLSEALDLIRDRVAESLALDGTRLERAFYDTERRLAFTGSHWNRGPFRGRSAEELTSTRDQWKQTMTGVVVVVLIGDRQLPLEAGGPILDEVVAVPSLLQFLREQVADTCDLDGVWLNRAFYDRNRVLNFGGLLGAADDRPELEQLTASLTREHSSWRREIPRGATFLEQRFSVLPIHELRTYIQDATPGYEALDGVAVERVFHLPNGAIAVEGRVVRGSQKNELDTVLTELLSATRHGQLRLEENLDKSGDFDASRMAVFAIERNIHESDDLLAAAWSLYWDSCYAQAIERLDMAIAYDSKSIAAWYLRTLCYIASGELDRARRDVRRGRVLELRSPATFSHNHFLNRVQGQDRLCFERLRLQALLTRPTGTLAHGRCSNSRSCGSADFTGRCQSPCCGQLKPVASPASLSVCSDCLMPGEPIFRGGCSRCGAAGATY